ncbi:MAG: YdeI/OmpD-associated family protein [Sphaerochaetaceae bacterium]|nr:YdeI/OmpD-associated family protein [Sphaerochaetaceae bacterium]
MLEQGPILSFSDRTKWRAWLAEHFKSESQAWLVFPMKEAGEPCISYNDAVEEALCFGWIDSTIKPLDALHRIQRFTPRHPGSTISRANIERLIWLQGQGLVHPQVLSEVQGIISAPYEAPEDIMKAIKEDPEAWNNLAAFPDPYKRIRIAYIDAARKRPLEFQRRLQSFIARTHENKLIEGYGGISKHYQAE